MKWLKALWSALVRGYKSSHQVLSGESHSEAVKRSSYGSGEMRVIYRVNGKIVYDGLSSQMPPDVRAQVERLEARSQHVANEIKEFFKED